MKVHTPFIFKHIPLVGPFLLVILGDGLGEGIEVMIFIVCLVRILTGPDCCDEIFNIPQHRPHTYDEFIVLPVQGVNVILAVEAAIHDQLNFP